jgi:N-acetylglucosaminyl-diphospho-decaprenol L-rhamnosyltransferase
MPELTVSIVNYKTPHLVVDCIASLKAHAPSRARLNIVVVDNDSGDDSLVIIGRAHPDITLIDAGGNLGFAAGNNLVLRDCRSAFVLLLNSDTLVEVGTLDHMVQALQEHPEVGAVSGRVVNASDGQDQDYPCHFPSLAGMVRRAIGGPEYPAQGHETPLPLERLHGACLMIRGSLLRSVGLLDDAFFMYDEDVDWCTRARRQGWELWLVPAARVLHHGGASSGRKPSGTRASLEASATALRMRYELRRSRYLLYRKHRSLWEVLALKALTDAAMALGCLKALGIWLVDPARREAAQAWWRSNLRIMALNPFELGAPAHKGHA